MVKNFHLWFKSSNKEMINYVLKLFTHPSILRLKTLTISLQGLDERKKAQYLFLKKCYYIKIDLETRLIDPIG